MANHCQRRNNDWYLSTMNAHDDIPDGFDPEQLRELGESMDGIVKGSETGYEIIFWIDENNAIELLETYQEAISGNPKAVSKCLIEYSKIMRHLAQALWSEDEDI